VPCTEKARKRERDVESEEREDIDLGHWHDQPNDVCVGQSAAHTMAVAQADATVKLRVVCRQPCTERGVAHQGGGGALTVCPAVRVLVAQGAAQGARLTRAVKLCVIRRQPCTERGLPHQGWRWAVAV
jgi:hypothetical protein